MATIGSVYVTEEAKTGEANWINLLNIIFPITVPKTDNSTMYLKDSHTSELCSTSVLKNPVKQRMIKAGMEIKIKFPKVIAMAETSCK